MLPSLTQHRTYTGQPLPEPWPFDYVLAAQGVIKRVSTPHFEAAFVVAEGLVRGLPVYPGLGVWLRVPRVPVELLGDVVQHARSLGRVEQMYHLRWSGKWSVTLPEQQAGAGRVRYDVGDDGDVVIDLHSHHTMAAYFSRTDDRDELGCRFYSVIGTLDDEPTLVTRVGVYGDYMRVFNEVIYDIDSE